MRAAFISQSDPYVMDNFDLDRIVRLTSEANSVPASVLLSERAVQNIRKNRAKQKEQEDAIQQQLLSAEVYNKTSKAPEAGSGAEMLRVM